jgi:hypothetical protein
MGYRTLYYACFIAEYRKKEGNQNEYKKVVPQLKDPIITDKLFRKLPDHQLTVSKNRRDTVDSKFISGLTRHNLKPIAESLIIQQPSKRAGAPQWFHSCAMWPTVHHSFHSDARHPSC